MVTVREREGEKGFDDCRVLQVVAWMYHGNTILCKQRALAGFCTPYRSMGRRSCTKMNGVHKNRKHIERKQEMIGMRKTQVRLAWFYHWHWEREVLSPGCFCSSW